MALALYNAVRYNEALYGIGSPERPAQPAVSGRPIFHAGQGDPLLGLRPEGALIRRVRETRRALERAERG